MKNPHATKLGKLSGAKPRTPAQLAALADARARKAAKIAAGDLNAINGRCQNKAEK